MPWTVQYRNGVDTFHFQEPARSVNCTPEELCRRTTQQPVALMGTLLVVEAQEAVQRALHRRRAGEVLAAEGDAPVLVQDGAR
jgi:hypothetical protein